MKVEIRLYCPESNNKITVDVKPDLGLSEQEWDALSHSEKKTILDAYVSELPEQPYWYVESFS